MNAKEIRELILGELDAAAVKPYDWDQDGGYSLRPDVGGFVATACRGWFGSLILIDARDCEAVCRLTPQGGFSIWFSQGRQESRVLTLTFADSSTILYIKNFASGAIASGVIKFTNATARGVAAEIKALTDWVIGKE